MAIGMFLLSRLEVGTSTAVASLYLFVLGLGMGLVMQVLVLAVQNSRALRGARHGDVGRDAAAEHRRRARDRGVRLDLLQPARRHAVERGIARFGAADARRRRAADRGAARGAARGRSDRVPAGLRRRALARLPRRGRRLVRRLRSSAGGCRSSRCVSTAADEPGRRRHPRRPARAGFAGRAGARARAAQPTRDERRRFHRGVAERAGVDISPGATWALVRIHEHGFAGAREQAERAGRRRQERIAEVVAELRGRGLVAGEEGAPEGTPAGRAPSPIRSSRRAATSSAELRRGRRVSPIVPRSTSCSGGSRGSWWASGRSAPGRLVRRRCVSADAGNGGHRGKRVGRARKRRSSRRRAPSLDVLRPYGA